MDFDPLAVDLYTEKTEEIREEQPFRHATWVHEDLAQVKIKVFQGHQDAVKTCSFCAEDRFALTSSLDKTVKLWDLDHGSLKHTYEGHDMFLSQARPNNTGDRFASCGWDKKLNVWNTETGRILWTGFHDSVVTCCSFSHDGTMLASGSDLDHVIKIWDVQNGELLHEISDLHSGSITNCIFSPKDDRIISCSMDKTTSFWDLKTTRSTLSIGGHINIISDVSVSQNEHRLATVSWDKSIALWDIATGAFRSKGPEKIEKAHEGCISSCDLSTDGMMLVTGGFDHQVSVWDSENNVQKLRLQGHEDWVEDVCFSNDHKWILSASKDKTLRLWNVDNYDDIPLVLEKRKAIGLKVYNCTACGKQFSVSQSDRAEDVKLCVFCRLKSSGS